MLLFANAAVDTTRGKVVVENSNFIIKAKLVYHDRKACPKCE